MFMGDIANNIKAGVIGWLTGNLAEGGIQPPQSFDAKGIIGFVLDLVGLGVAGIKKIATDVFGRTVVAAIEKGVEGAEKIAEIFGILVSEGPGGLFRYLQAEFVRMRDQAIEQIGKAMAESLVIAGIKKVLGIISGLVSGGVGTVVTIVSTIIDLVLWFRDNAQQISELDGLYENLCAVVVYPPFKVAEVLELTSNGVLLPPGVTRFTVSPRALRVNYPLEQLSSNRTLEEKNEYLERWIGERTARKGIRFYTEATVLFDE